VNPARVLRQEPRVRGLYGGAPPSGLRLAHGALGTLEPPEPEVVVARINASRYGFTAYEEGWIHGTWYCGTKFAKSSYWGQYPGNIVARIQTMFPVERLLHLCSGHTYITGAVNLDIMPTPARDVQADAAALPFRDDSFAVALIDPPYSQEDSQRYGVKRLIRSKATLEEARRVLTAGGYLVWLDERYPAFRRADWKLMGLIGIVTGFERRSRLLSFFRSTKGLSSGNGGSTSRD
jgi:hypothetical protein